MKHKPSKPDLFIDWLQSESCSDDGCPYADGCIKTPGCIVETARKVYDAWIQSIDPQPDEDGVVWRCRYPADKDTILY